MTKKIIEDQIKDLLKFCSKKNKKIKKSLIRKFKRVIIVRNEAATVKT